MGHGCAVAGLRRGRAAGGGRGVHAARTPLRSAHMSRARAKTAEPAAAPTPRGRALFRRIAAGVVSLPLFYLVTRAGSFAFLGFVDLFIFLGMLEFYGMMR